MTQNTIKLPVFLTIKDAWQRVKGSKRTFWGILLTLALVFVAALLLIFESALFTFAQSRGHIPKAVIVHCAELVTGVLVFTLQGSLIYVGIQRAMNHPISFRMVRRGFDMGIIVRMIGLAILMFIVSLPATIFLFLPSLILTASSTASSVATSADSFMRLITALCYMVGMIVCVYLNFRMLLASFLVIVKKLNPWQAIKVSFKATKSNVWRLIGLMIVSMIIFVVSALPLGIGLIWTLPLIMITYGMVYKTLVVARQDLNI